LTKLTFDKIYFAFYNINCQIYIALVFLSCNFDSIVFILTNYISDKAGARRSCMVHIGSK